MANESNGNAKDGAALSSSSIDAEIAWWTNEMNKAKKQELAVLCFGAVLGLKLARAYYIRSAP